MKLLTSVVTLAALAAVPASAQITSPAGLDVIEGNSSTTALFGAIDRRFQQIDGTLIGGGPLTITQISLRRDGDRSAPTATSRNIDITIAMAHADSSAVSQTFTDNYVTTPTVVLATTQVNFPDWTASTPGPAPRDLAITLDTPFNYNGTDALLIEIIAENSDTFSQLYLDRQLGNTPYNFAPGVPDPSVTGCTVDVDRMGMTGEFTASVDAFNYGVNHPILGQRLVLSASNAVADSPVSIHVCLNTPAIQVPGLCGPFLPDLIVGLQLGLSGPTGSSTDLTIDVEYNPALDGIPIAVQALCLDTQQGAFPVAVSAVETSMIPLTNPILDCHYVYGGPADTFGFLFSNRGIVIGLD